MNLNFSKQAASGGLALLLCFAVSMRAATGDTVVAKWKDNKRAAFLLLYDDSCASHYQIGIPELERRDLIGTFYVNPGHSNWTTSRTRWETTVPTTTKMVYGNHSWSHNGASTIEAVETEIRLCQEAIDAICFPSGTPHLTSWGQPGVNQWVYGAPLQALLDKYRLIGRPAFDAAHATVYGFPTAAPIVALADDAIARGSMQYVVMHGLERRASQGDPDWGYQDFWAFNRDEYRTALDAIWLRAERGDLWVTDHISQHKYEAIRASNPTITPGVVTADRITLAVATSLDTQLYNQPLTLRTEVPATWPGAIVTQGARTATVHAEDGVVQYDALADGTTITLTCASLPVVSVRSLAQVAQEQGAVPGSFRIGGAGGSGLSVRYAISATTPILAGSGSRYSVPASPASFVVGVSQIDVNVTPGPDDLYEGPQFITLTLQPGSGYLVSDTARKAMVMLRDKPFDDWKFVQFGTSANNASVAGDTAVRNAAGMTNLLAYSQGVVPTKAIAAELPASGPQTFGAARHLAITFKRNPALVDLTYLVEVSDDLRQAGGWTAVAASGAGAAPTGPGFVSESGTTLKTVIARDPDPVGAHPRRFIRLRVSR